MMYLYPVLFRLLRYSLPCVYKVLTPNYTRAYCRSTETQQIKASELNKLFDTDRYRLMMC